MKKRAIIMGMTVNISIVDPYVRGKDFEEVFAFLRSIDERFSLYKENSEISKLNLGSIDLNHISSEMKTILELSKKTREETNGYFNIERNFKKDPSGIVKGYAISKSADILRNKGYKNFFIEIAGDIETNGLSENGHKWKIGIENPFNPSEIIKIVHLENGGIATSGNYRRGKHIYDPHSGDPADEIASFTVISNNAYEADRFATAAFAMGEKGIFFIEEKSNVEGFMVTKDKKARMTSGFVKFLN